MSIADTGPEGAKLRMSDPGTDVHTVQGLSCATEYSVETIVVITGFILGVQ